MRQPTFQMLKHSLFPFEILVASISRALDARFFMNLQMSGKNVSIGKSLVASGTDVFLFFGKVDVQHVRLQAVAMHVFLRT